MTLDPPDSSALFYALADGALGAGDTTLELPAVEALRERLLQAESQATEASVRAAYAELEVAVGGVVTEAVFLDICARAAVTHEASQEVAGAQQDAGPSDEVLQRIARRGEEAEFPEVLPAELALVLPAREAASLLSLAVRFPKSNPRSHGGGIREESSIRTGQRGGRPRGAGARAVGFGQLLRATALHRCRLRARGGPSRICRSRSESVSPGMCGR